MSESNKRKSRAPGAENESAESMKDQASALLGIVSRFKLGDHSHPVPVAPARRMAGHQQGPSPIKVRPNALPPAYAAAIGSGTSRKPRAQSKEWEEF